MKGVRSSLGRKVAIASRSIALRHRGRPQHHDIDALVMTQRAAFVIAVSIGKGEWPVAPPNALRYTRSERVPLNSLGRREPGVEDQCRDRLQCPANDLRGRRETIRRHHVGTESDFQGQARPDPGPARDAGDSKLGIICTCSAARKAVIPRQSRRRSRGDFSRKLSFIGNCQRCQRTPRSASWSGTGHRNRPCGNLGSDSCTLACHRPCKTAAASNPGTAV
jgi:hypothetical protein